MALKSRTLLAVAGALLILAALPLMGASTAQPPATIAKKPHSKLHHARRHHRVRGQKAIDDTRVRQIQEALVREHYLKGDPSGKWDANTQAAMRRYQSDQGWQTKTVPDARALIRLGLGPDQEHLLNPDSAMTTEPAMAHSKAAKSTMAVTNPGTAGAAPAGASPVSTPADANPQR
jgi:peptidoglycan hydrolase-like protein with peptidoglycan-binding domain